MAGVAAPVGGVGLTLNSNSAGEAFTDAFGVPLTGASLTIPEGLGSASFGYRDTLAGSSTLTGSGGTESWQVPVTYRIFISALDMAWFSGTDGGANRISLDHMTYKLRRSGRWRWMSCTKDLRASVRHPAGDKARRVIF